MNLRVKRSLFRNCWVVWAVSKAQRKKSQKWEMLIEKVSVKLDQVKLALANIHTKELDLAEKAKKILSLKKQYSINLTDLEKVDHDVEVAMRLRKFMIHLDKTLDLVKKEAKKVELEKKQVNEEFIKLEKERLKFETLQNRTEEKYQIEVARKENLERDLSNSLRFSKIKT